MQYFPPATDKFSLEVLDITLTISMIKTASFTSNLRSYTQTAVAGETTPFLLAWKELHVFSQSKNSFAAGGCNNLAFLSNMVSMVTCTKSICNEGTQNRAFFVLPRYINRYPIDQFNLLEILSRILRHLKASK